MCEICNPVAAGLLPLSYSLFRHFLLCCGSLVIYLHFFFNFCRLLLFSPIADRPFGKLPHFWSISLNSGLIFEMGQISQKHFWAFCDSHPRQLVIFIQFLQIKASVQKLGENHKWVGTEIIKCSFSSNLCGIFVLSVLANTISGCSKQWNGATDRLGEARDSVGGVAHGQDAAAQDRRP